MDYDSTWAIRKLVPIDRVHGRAPIGDQPIAYLSTRRYILVAGSDIVNNLRVAGEDFIEITEIPAPVRSKAISTFDQLMCTIPLTHEALVSYQPIMVEGVNQSRRWTSAEVRLDNIVKVLAPVCFPFAGKSLLDLGSAVGFMSISMDSYGFRVTSIDCDERCVSIARAYNELVQGSVDFRVGDVREFISECTDTYDVILCINCLHWLFKQRETVPQAIDFIRRLGALVNYALVIATPLDSTSGLTDLIPVGADGTEALRRWCKGSFDTVEFVAAGPRHPMWICKK